MAVDSSPRTCLAGMRAFIINLERRPDRRLKIESIAEALGLDYTILRAVDGRELKRQSGRSVHVGGCVFQHHWALDDGSGDQSHLVRISSARDEDERWTVLGCLLSHTAVLQRMLVEDLDHALVLEDDCELACKPVDLHEAYRVGAAFLADAHGDWQLLYLGGVMGFRPWRKGAGERAPLKVPGTEGLIHAAGTYQAHAYIIRSTAISEVMKRLQAGYAADAALVSTVHAADCNRHFRFSPALLNQAAGGRWRDSDIIIGASHCRKRTRRLAKPAIENENIQGSHRASFLHPSSFSADALVQSTVVGENRTASGSSTPSPTMVATFGSVAARDTHLVPAPSVIGSAGASHSASSSRTLSASGISSTSFCATASLAPSRVQVGAADCTPAVAPCMADVVIAEDVVAPLVGGDHSNDSHAVCSGGGTVIDIGDCVETTPEKHTSLFEDLCFATSIQSHEDALLAVAAQLMFRDARLASQLAALEDKRLAASIWSMEEAQLLVARRQTLEDERFAIALQASLNAL